MAGLVQILVPSKIILIDNNKEKSNNLEETLETNNLEEN